MTRLVFFDSDCLSSFLWIGAESLLALCFPQGMILPQPVYEELSKVAHLKHQVDIQIELGNMSLLDIQSGTQAYRMYVDMVRGRDQRIPRIGKGEAAAIVLAYTQDGILASNNLRYHALHSVI